MLLGGFILDGVFKKTCLKPAISINILVYRYIIKRKQNKKVTVKSPCALCEGCFSHAIRRVFVLLWWTNMDRKGKKGSFVHIQTNNKMSKQKHTKTQFVFEPQKGTKMCKKKKRFCFDLFRPAPRASSSESSMFMSPKPLRIFMRLPDNLRLGRVERFIYVPTIKKSHKSERP